MSAELKSMRSIDFAMKTLMAGFTTVRDVGSDSQYMYALRDAMSDNPGTIELGKHADIIATDGSPLENIKKLLDVDFVMKSGKVYKSRPYICKDDSRYKCPHLALSCLSLSRQQCLYNSDTGKLLFLHNPYIRLLTGYAQGKFKGNAHTSFCRTT